MWRSVGLATDPQNNWLLSVKNPIEDTAGDANALARMPINTMILINISSQGIAEHMHIWLCHGFCDLQSVAATLLFLDWHAMKSTHSGGVMLNADSVLFILFNRLHSISAEAARADYQEKERLQGSYWSRRWIPWQTGRSWSCRRLRPQQPSTSGHRWRQTVACTPPAHATPLSFAGPACKWCPVACNANDQPPCKLRATD